MFPFSALSAIYKPDDSTRSPGLIFIEITVPVLFTAGTKITKNILTINQVFQKKSIFPYSLYGQLIFSK
jgi:hypothetical protein